MIYAILALAVILWPALTELIDALWTGRRFSLRIWLDKLLVSIASALYAIGLLSILRSLGPLEIINRYPVIIIAAVIVAGLAWLVIGGGQKKTVIRRKLNSRDFLPLIILLLIAIGLEATVFNFRSFQSLTFEPADNFLISTSSSIITSEGISSIDAALGQPEIYLTEIDQELGNIYIDIDPANGKFSDDKDDTLLASHVVKLIISATDEANSSPISLPEIAIADDVEGTHYITLNLSGKVSELTIRMTNLNDREFVIRSVVLNKHVPYEFSLWRVLVVFLLMTVIWMVRPKSQLYRHLLDFRVRWQGNAIILTGVILVIVLILMASSNPYCNGTIFTGHRTQYETFSEVLAKGQFYFDYEVDPKLAALDNPYDPAARRAAGAAYKWDHAYFDGKYYMYFGIVPEILMFLPYRLIAGENLPTFISVGICLVALAAGILALLYKIARTWFARTSFLIYIMLATSFILAIGSIIAKYPSVYIVPIATAVALGIWGLYFWIKVKTCKPSRIKYNLLVGSLLIALIFGCRPQVGLVFLAAVPLLWAETIEQRLLFSRKGLLNTALFILPFLVVAAGLMYYNAARFGSPFDFGAQYNITTNDMTRRGFVLDRIPIGLFTYFVQFPVLTAQFPFFNPARLVTRYQGLTINETTFGSVFMTFPILLAALFGRTERKQLKEKGLRGLTFLLPVLAALIAVTDIEVAGILQRYTADFSWLLFIGAAIVIYAMAEARPDPTQSPWFYRAMAIAFLFTLAYGSLYFFLNEASSYSAEYSTAVFYHRVADLVEFWR